MKNTKKQALYSIDDVETDTVDEEEERQKQIRESGSVIAKKPQAYRSVPDDHRADRRALHRAVAE
jgi:ABC-type sugar transport system substrate-binding protein